MSITPWYKNWKSGYNIGPDLVIYCSNFDPPLDQHKSVQITCITQHPLRPLLEAQKNFQNRSWRRLGALKALLTPQDGPRRPLKHLPKRKTKSADFDQPSHVFGQFSPPKKAKNKNEKKNLTKNPSNRPPREQKTLQETFKRAKSKKIAPFGPHSKIPQNRDFSV